MARFEHGFRAQYTGTFGYHRLRTSDILSPSDPGDPHDEAQPFRRFPRSSLLQFGTGTGSRFDRSASEAGGRSGSAGAEFASRCPTGSDPRHRNRSPGPADGRTASGVVSPV